MVVKTNFSYKIVKLGIRIRSSSSPTQSINTNIRFYVVIIAVFKQIAQDKSVLSCVILGTSLDSTMTVFVFLNKSFMK